MEPRKPRWVVNGVRGCYKGCVGPASRAGEVKGWVENKAPESLWVVKALLASLGRGQGLPAVGASSLPLGVLGGGVKVKVGGGLGRGPAPGAEMATAEAAYSE